MGYCHSWEIEQEIDRESFSRIVADVQRMVLTLDDIGVRLAGPLGEDVPEVDADLIAFNGLWHCGHAKNEEIVIPFPAAGAAGIGNSIDAVEGVHFGMGTLLKHRTCDGNCSHETFRINRDAELILTGGALGAEVSRPPQPDSGIPNARIKIQTRACYELSRGPRWGPIIPSSRSEERRIPGFSQRRATLKSEKLAPARRVAAQIGSYVVVVLV